MSRMMRWVRLPVLLRLQLSAHGTVTNLDNRESTAQFMPGKEAAFQFRCFTKKLNSHVISQNILPLSPPIPATAVKECVLSNCTVQTEE